MHLFVKEDHAKLVFFSSLGELQTCENEIHCHSPIIFFPFIHLQIPATVSAFFSWKEKLLVD